MGANTSRQIRRIRLEERLSSAVDRRLTLLIADAGYGKTTVLRAWEPTLPRAWHTITQADSLPGVLARHLIDALMLRVPDLSADFVVATTSSRGDEKDEENQVEAAAAGLAEVLTDALNRHTVLVLEDVHEVRGAPAAVRFIEALVRQSPPLLHIVITSRDELPFRAARMLAHGEADEISHAELAFTMDETERLVATCHGRSDSELAKAVHAATGGWPVATRLAIEATAGANSADRVAMLDAARKPNGVLLDYVAQEVIGRETGDVLDLLIHAEPLDAFDSTIATAIGITGAERVIAQVRQRGVYVQPVPGWPERVTLTPLFRSSVQEHRRLPEPERAAIMAAAAAWHEQAGEPGPALAYWVRLGDAAQCARMLCELGEDLAAAGRAHDIVAAAQLVPPAERSVPLEMLAGDAYRLLGSWPEALACYERAIPAEEDVVPARVAWRVGLLHHLRGELGTAIAAYDRGDVDDPDVTARSLLLGWLASACWLRGDLDRCRELATRAFDAARAGGDDRARANAHTVLAMVSALDGDREANDVHYQRALHHAVAAHDVLQLVRIHANRSSRNLEEGDAEGALAEVDVALRMADLGGFAALRALALSNRGEALLALGRLDEARAELDSARALFERLNSPMAAYPYGSLGDLHRLRGDNRAAATAYETAIALAERVNDQQGLAPALSGLARLIASDDPDRAEKLVGRAMAGGPSLAQIRARVTAGQVCLLLGRQDVAAEHAAHAQREAQLQRDRAGQAEALELLAAARGDRTAAKDAAALWRELKNPVGAARAAVAVAELVDTPQVAIEIADGAVQEADALGARTVAARGRTVLAKLRSVAPPEVQLVCLGGFAVLRDGDPVPSGAWQSRKARELLKLLVCRRGRPIHREQMAELLWPDGDPAKTANRLSVALSTVRSVLDPDQTHAADHYLHTDGEAVSLRHADVDVERFLDYAAAGLAITRTGEEAEAWAYLQVAERAYSGDLFEDDPYPDWAVDLREQARLTYLDVARRLADLSDDPDARARYLLRILEQDPYDEKAHMDLVGLLAGAGRHGEARRRYRLYARRMSEIDVEAAPYPPGAP